MSRRTPPHRRHPRHAPGDPRLAQLGLTFLLAGLALTMVELVVLGGLTAPAIGFDVIGAALLPVGVLRMFRWPEASGEDSGWDEDGPGGGGGPGIGPEPVGPTGGLEVDWEAFERDFQAYAEAHADTVSV